MEKIVCVSVEDIFWFYYGNVILATLLLSVLLAMLNLNLMDSN